MTREITYEFRFEDKTTWHYTIQFDQNNYFVPKEDTPPKDWTKLDNFKCPHCPLNSADTPYCPVAKNLNQIVEDSKDTLSSVPAEILVHVPERTYVKTSGTQEGLRSLFGLIMSTSGCPYLDWLRPLARFHLPFAMLDETVFRVLSLQLLYHYFNNSSGTLADCGQEIKAHYQDVQKLNHTFIERIRAYCKADADKNAIAALDACVLMFTVEYETDFKSLKKYFT